VTEHQRQPRVLELTVVDVEIRATHPAGVDAHQHLSRPRPGSLPLHLHQRGSHPFEHHRAHQRPPPSWSLRVEWRRSQGDFQVASSFVLTIIGPDKPGLVERLSDTVTEHGGNWLESRMAHLGGQFAGILRVSVPESQANDLRAALERLEKEPTPEAKRSQIPLLPNE